MSFTVHVQPSGHSFEANEGETILDAALRNGFAFPYGCRGGACGACKGKLLSGSVAYPEGDPIAYGPATQQLGEEIFCKSVPTSDVTVEVHEVGSVKEIPVRKMPTRVASMERANDEVMVLSLQLPEGERLQYLAGQYVDFLLEDGRRRSFSIANAPHDDAVLEFHIRHIKGGEFTDRVFKEMKTGDVLRIRGPQGSFFLREDSERPVIMLATGTGFGPIKGIVEHAIAEGSQRPIYIYWGARNQDELYMDEMARGWDADNANIHYIPVLSRPDEGWEGKTGHVQDVAAAEHADLAEFELYACGHPEMVYSAKEALVAKGINPDHCYSDAFEWQKD